MYSFLKYLFWILIVALIYDFSLAFDIYDNREEYRDKKTYKNIVAIVFVISIVSLIACVSAQNNLPYKQELRNLKGKAIDMGPVFSKQKFYKDDGSYFMLYRYKVSEEDFDENGWKYMRLDFDESRIDNSMMGYTDSLISHYENLRREEATHDVYRLCCNLYTNNDDYYILDPVPSDDPILGFDYKENQPRKPPLLSVGMNWQL